MTALADSLDAFTRWTKTIEARFEELAEHWRVLQAHRQRIEALEVSLSCPPPSSPLLQRVVELEGTVRRLSEQVFDSPEAKPGPSFTARAGETITIKCVIPNCEVCERIEAMSGAVVDPLCKHALSPTDEKAKLFRVTWDEVVALVREARVAQAELQKYDGSTRTYWVIDRFYAALKPFEGVE